MNSKERGMEKSRAQAHYNAKDIIRFLVPRILFGICGFFAAQATLPFGARPFGVALLAAASGRAVLPVYFGLSIASLATIDGSSGYVYFVIYTALLLARAVINLSRGVGELSRGKKIDVKALLEKAFCDKLGARILISATFGLALGTSILFFGGMLYYDLFALLVLMSIAPVATALLCGFFERGRFSDEVRTLWRDVGFLVLSGIFVYGARGTVVYGVSLSVLGAFLATFYVSYLKGIGYGAILGLALGICYSPMLSPMFVLAAVCAGIFIRFSAALACFCAFFAASAWAFYVEGLSALLGVFGGILSACLLYSVIHKIIFVDLAKANAGETKERVEKKEDRIECRVLSDSALDGVKLYDMNLRMSAVNDGLCKLSAVFEEAKKSRADYENEVKYSDEKYNYRFGDTDDVPDYKMFSALLAKTMEQGENDYKIDVELSQRICGVLTELNLSVFGVAVFGVRKKTIYIKGKSRALLEENTANIIESISPLLPFLIDSKGFEVRRESEGGSGSLLVFEAQKIKASVVRRRVIAKNEIVCGDSTSVFKNRDDRFFAILSDGMGSGCSASVVSRMCTGFISNMLSVGGIDVELISMLNGFICGRRIGGDIECSATLDLLELDLMSGKADVYKCGAAPSYVYRKGKLFKIRSKTMPIGILKDVDLKHFSFNFCSGDVVIMMSDGVTGEGGECPWLFDLLIQNLPCRSLERTAELIIKYSVAKGSVDDISVVLIEIK